MGGTFEQWSNKNKIQRDHTLGTLCHKSLSQNVSAGWLNKCCSQGKADHRTVCWKSSHAFVLSFWNIWVNEKYYSVVIKWKVEWSLNIFCTQYFIFCLICIVDIILNTFKMALCPDTAWKSKLSHKSRWNSFCHTYSSIHKSLFSIVQFFSISNCLYLKSCMILTYQRFFLTHFFPFSLIYFNIYAFIKQIFFSQRLVIIILWM